MNINKLNEIMKKHLDEGFFGNIQEEDELDIESKLTSLLKSGTPDNIELAFMIAQGQDFDIDTLTEELFDLQFWMDNLEGISQSSKAEALSFLLTQTKIDLSKKKLSKLSESIGNLQNLERLSLYNNNLSSLSESIGNLHNLQRLDLDNNQLSSLPESIGNLQNLQRLDLYDNNLRSLPESIGRLQNLEVLDLSGNKLSRLPESIGNLQNLNVLWLAGNKLSIIEINHIKAMLPNCRVHD